MPYIYSQLRYCCAPAMLVALCCCAPAVPDSLQDEAPGHLTVPVASAVEELPPPALPPEPALLYSVDVDSVPARELVLALVRDAGLSADLQAVPAARVTLYAPSQPLIAILERIVALAGWRMDARQGQLLFAPDEAYARVYHIGYLDMARTASSNVQVATRIKSVDDSASAFAGNDSTTSVSSASEHNFWQTLKDNLDSMVATGEVVVNPAAGVVAVTARQTVHRQIAEFLEALRAGAYRQVLIEATIVEISLEDEFNAGIDWSLFADSVFSVEVEGLVPDTSTLVVEYDNAPPGFALNAMLSALHRFGDTRVLSSPRLMALNNQTALLKVVDNVVYFTINQQTTLSVQGSSESATSSEVHTVPVGLVMSVTPHIDSDGAVILSVRPSVSQINNFVEDPNPALAGRGNRVPQVRVRELESLLRLEDGQVAVLGGLMQDRSVQQQSKVPWLSELPLVGAVFTGSERLDTRTELVILLRPIVLRSPRELPVCCA